MFELIKKIFIGLLTGLVNRSNQARCVLLSNQKCMTQPLLLLIYILMSTAKNFTNIHFQCPFAYP